jgi:hypothetical protein
MIRLSGYSDDNVSTHIDGEDDEIGCYDNDVAFVIGEPKAKAGQNAHGLRVRMHYGGDGRGCWAAHISPIDEGVGCPWPVAVRFENYTAVVEIGCPKGTRVAHKVVKS